MSPRVMRTRPKSNGMVIVKGTLHCTTAIALYSMIERGFFFTDRFGNTFF